MAKRTGAPLGASLVVLSSIFYASYGVWTKLMGTFFGAFTQVTLRSFITVAILFAIALWRKKLGRIYWRRDAKWLICSFVSAIFVGAPLYYAILHAGIGISLVVVYLAMVLGMFFFGWLFDKEKVTRDKWLSTALGIVGLVLVFAPSTRGAAWFPLVAALVSGLGTAFNLATSKKMPYNSSQTAVIVWTLGLLANLPFIFIFQEVAPAPSWDIEWLYLGIFGVISVAASWSAIHGVKLIEAGAAGILGLLEIVFGLLFGILLFSERPGVLALVGVLAITAAAAIPYLKDYNAKRGTLEET